MNKNFKLDNVTLLHNNISIFFDYPWDKNMSLEELIVGLHRRLNKVRKIDLNVELKNHIFLKKAKLEVTVKVWSLVCLVVTALFKYWQQVWELHHILRASAGLNS